MEGEYLIVAIVHLENLKERFGDKFTRYEQEAISWVLKMLYKERKGTAEGKPGGSARGDGAQV